MALQTTGGPAGIEARPGRSGVLQRGMDLLRHWQERIASRRQLGRLCDLDDHILQDIGLTRSE